MSWIVVLLVWLGSLASQQIAAEYRMPTLFVPEILAEFPHDPGSLTQGLIWHEGTFYESAGLYGESDVREVDPATGEVLRERAVDAAYFAEGLALVDGRLIQLTWRESAAFVYDRETFEPVGEFTYDTEGWGLCYDGTQLVMSDGSATLFFRDPETFEVIREVQVRLQGTPLTRLNELECVNGLVYANVWTTDYLVVIEPRHGRVTGVIYAGGLLTEEERQTADVLNGIAYNPDTETFYITGKRWPKLFEVRFVEYVPPE